MPLLLMSLATFSSVKRVPPGSRAFKLYGCFHAEPLTSRVVTIGYTAVANPLGIPLRTAEITSFLLNVRWAMIGNGRRPGVCPVVLIVMAFVAIAGAHCAPAFGDIIGNNL